MGVQVIEFYFHKVNKVKVSGLIPRVLGAKVFQKKVRFFKKIS